MAIAVLAPIAMASDPLRGALAELVGAEPNSDKAAFFDRIESDDAKAAQRSMAPVQGPPSEEQWQPDIREGFIEDASSPYEGLRPFKVTNAWQTSLSPDGRFWSIYAGDEFGKGLVIIIELDLMTTGTETVHLEVPVPFEHPRIESVAGGTAVLSTPNGAEWLLDFQSGELTVSAALPE
jgi:hypothetical protein